MKEFETMSDNEFENYLNDRRKVKPYLDRYVREGGYSLDIPFEEWCKREIRNDKLKELLDGKE